MIIKDFNNTIDFWIKELKHYNFIQLCAKPAPNSWSLGQVYMHIIEQTNYYLSQIDVCLSNNKNSNEEMSPNAKTMFHSNNFPDAVIEGPPTNANTPQPGNKEELMSSLLNLKEKINKAGIMILKSQYNGKTKHPGLKYFNANEWLQFAEMHFRHHLRQKKRIDEFLKTIS